MMDKNKIIKLVNSHHSLFCLCSKVYNNISLKNKLHTKGCKVKAGVSIIKGLFKDYK